MNATAQPIGRRYRHDQRGWWHEVDSAPCDDCGCRYDYSIDQPGALWEAGPSIEGGCRDRRCDCHADPMMGDVFDEHVWPAARDLAS
jgi:hypothetical protein